MGLDVGEIGMGADLSLDLKMFAAKSLGRVREAPAAAMDDCIRRLGGEKSKIEVFRRELPLCARLLADVIDVMKKEVEEKKRGGDRGEDKEDAGAGDKSNWMSTAQLWTGDSVRGDDASEKQDARRRSSEPESHDGAALPFKAVGSGAPAFAPPSLRKDDKAVRMPDLPFLSPAPIKTSPAAATGGAGVNHRNFLPFLEIISRKLTWLFFLA
uniref:HHO5-like N-terminal domain-containing protein n=1 Tax=Triticum urartu TaxID=4572 RepID=A0A8R7R9L4_TRIUA